MRLRKPVGYCPGRDQTLLMSEDLEEGLELQLDFTNLERVAGGHVIP